MEQENKTRIIAIAGTIAFHVLLLVISLCFVIEHSPQHDLNAQWPPVDSSEILFGGEYVMLGDMQQPLEESDQQQPAPSADENDAPPADDLQNSGSKGEPAQVVTTPNESPMKVEKKPVETPKPGPTEEELAAAAEKARIEKEKQQKIQEQIRNQFASKGKSSDEGGKGKTGQTDGNSESGATSGSPGADLGGRTLAHWVKTSSTKAGTIVVAVSVSPQGKVISAKVKSGSGPAYADAATRTRCEQASLKCSFSVSKTETKEQRGTITWRFK